MPAQQKILVVDDDPDIGHLIKMILEHKNYSVTAADKLSGLTRELAENDFKLLIMDMLLSGGDGKDFCKTIKQTKEIPVLMMSAHPNAKEICLSSGADDFISKPFDMHELISKVNRLIDREPLQADKNS